MQEQQAKYEFELMIEVYDAIERANYKKSSYSERVMFSPVAFLKANSPTRLNTAEELSFFIDFMHEGRTNGVMEKSLGGGSPLMSTCFSRRYARLYSR